MFLVGCFFLSSYHFILLKMRIKIAASVERVFRLRLAAPNDTICLSRAYAFRSYVCRSGVGSTGAVFIYNNFSLWPAILFFDNWQNFCFSYFCIRHMISAQRLEDAHISNHNLRGLLHRILFFSYILHTVLVLVLFDRLQRVCYCRQPHYYAEKVSVQIFRKETEKMIGNNCKLWSLCIQEKFLCLEIHFYNF